MLQTIAYRSNFFISILVTAILFLSSFFLWENIFGENSKLLVYSWEMMKGYLLVAFMCNTLLSWYSESAISKKIVDGSVALDLLKPIDYSLARFFETIGASVFEIFVIAVISAIFVFFMDISLPRNPVIWICFGMSIVVSLGIKFCIVYIFSLCTFFTTSYHGIAWSRAAITNLLSGALLPLDFFPVWLASLIEHMPFRFIVYVPAMIFLNQLDAEQIYKVLLEAVIWIIGLALISKLVFKFCIRKVVINGG